MPRKKPAPVKAKPVGTKPTQVRLTPSDKAKIEYIRERSGLPSLASVLRWLADEKFRIMKNSEPGG